MKKIIFLLLLISCVGFPVKGLSENDLPKEPGTYPVRTSYVEDSNELEKMIYVTVKGPNTVIEDGIAIDAKDFILTIQQLKKLTAQKAIIYSEAKAWSTIDGSEKAIATVDLSNLQPVEGVYKAVFSTQEGVSKTVNVTVGVKLLGNKDFNSYKSMFEKSYWRFLLVIGLLLVVILSTPVVIVVLSGKNMVKVIDQLIDIFSK